MIAGSAIDHMEKWSEPRYHDCRKGSCAVAGDCCNGVPAAMPPARRADPQTLAAKCYMPIR
jgi:hypothetical protein